jgi:hypothetical protein
MMAVRRDIPQSLSSVRISAVRAYLRSNGYIYREHWGKYLDRYSRKARSREDNVLIPTEIGISDYERRLAEALETLARQLERPFSTLLRDVVNSGYEVVRIRVNEGEEESTVAYDTTIDLLRGGFALIDASAVLAVAQERLPIIRGRRPDVVRRYLDEVRVGQTEVGSFVLTLLMPVGVNSAGLDLPASISDGFGTRVSETFSGSLKAAEEAVRAERIQSNRALIERGVTANFSRGIARIIQSAGGVSISLAQLGAGQGISKRVQSRFSPNDYARLCDIEERLTPRGDSEPFTVTGTVTEFHEPRGKSNGSIVVNCLVHGEMRQVRMKFERPDRAAVVQAIESKAHVFLEVDGDLTSKGGHLHLERAGDFRTVPRGPLA